jgi:hypothetical protein
MIQQSHSWVHIKRKLDQYVEEIAALSCFFFFCTSMFTATLFTIAKYIINTDIQQQMN